MSVSTQKSISRSSWFHSPGSDLTSSTSSTNQNILTGMLSIGFLLVTWDIITLILHHPVGYVIDIYSALPGSFFLTLIVCFLIGSVALLAGTNRNRKLSILLLIFIQLTILIIPYMLGYYSMGRSDDMTYIGEYVHIANTGQIAGWDIYPSSLIIGAILTFIPGLAVNQAAFIVPIVFSLLFTVGLVLCCKIITTNRFYVDIAILSSFVLYLGSFNFANTPNALFFAFVPLFIYVMFRYVKAQNLPNAIILLVLTILIPFTHPFIFYFVFAFVTLLVLLNPIMKKLSDFDYRTLGHPLLIMLCVFLAWFISSEVLLDQFRSSYLAYITRASQSVLNETTGKLSIFDFNIIELSKLLLVYYGRYIIPSIFIVLSFLYVILKKERLSEEMKKKLKFLIVLYLICLVLEGIIVVNPLITHTADRISNLNFIVYAQVPLFAFSMLVLFPRSGNGRKAIAGLAIVILVLTTTWGLSLYGTFNSPNTFEPNSALAYNEVDSMKWFYESRADTNISTTSSQLTRFHDLFDDGLIDNEISIPDHFGYNQTQVSFSEATLKEGQQTYVVIPTIDRLLYQDVPVYSTVARYTQNDFNRFTIDPSVDKVYDGLNIEIYHSSWQ